MKTIVKFNYGIFLICFLILGNTQKTNACNANYTHSNSCAGDTVFFFALDQFAVYTWDFGDTTSGTANISHDTDAYHVFVNPGTYFVTLFVNIGAEWDYQTQIINVGTDCFAAGFATECQGSNFIRFYNESVGDGLSYSWNFGDPASGTSDTSSLFDLNHLFTAVGTYNVTLVITDGIQSDTTTQLVTVDSNCINATFYNFLGGNCVQNATTISPLITGNVTSYLWDFGDTTSGSANTSTDSLGIHQFSSPGIYFLTLTISDGIQTKSFNDVQYIIDCDVFPGNTNRDGEVNMEDLFAVGIFYGDTGTVRTGATLNWSAQPCTDWFGGNFNGIMYLQDMVDKKNADCNGDGVINSSDVSAIQQNYGNRVPDYFRNDQMSPLAVRTTDPTLQVLTGSAQFIAGDTLNLFIDLSNITTIENVYGIAARLYYDTALIVPGSVNITFDSSWIGTEGLDLIGINKDFYSNGYIDFGIVRTDKIKATGNGAIATLTCITRGSVAGITNFSFDPAVKLISNGSFSNNQEIFSPVNIASNYISTVVTTIDNINNKSFVLYPNPATSELRIQMNNNESIQKIELINVLGKVCLTESFTTNDSHEKIVNTSSLSKGIYQLRLKSEKNIFTQPVVIVAN